MFYSFEIADVPLSFSPESLQYVTDPLTEYVTNSLRYVSSEIVFLLKKTITS